MLATENCLRRTGGSDHDIGTVAVVVKIVEADGLTFEAMRQAYGAIISPVGNEDRFAAMSNQVAGGEFAHLAGSHDKNILALQRAEYLFSEFNCDGRDRN